MSCSTSVAGVNDSVNKNPLNNLLDSSKEPSAVIQEIRKKDSLFPFRYIVRGCGEC